MLKEASLAVIAHLLLDQKHKTTLKKIFKIMDASGDGQLEADELFSGFKSIFNSASDRDRDNNPLYKKMWSDDELNRIIRAVDHNDNGFLDYRDFLMASVDLSQTAFLRYCERAKERFFTGGAAMQTNELYEILCKENIFRRELIQKILVMFDADGSDSIQFEELVAVLLEHLGDDIHPKTTAADVERHIEHRFDTDFLMPDEQQAATGTINTAINEMA